MLHHQIGVKGAIEPFGEWSTYSLHHYMLLLPLQQNGHPAEH
jgi:hypothetical protein